MPKVRITETIQFRSEVIATGCEVDLSDLDAQQLIESNQAEAIPADLPKTPKTSSPKE